jgi:DNA-binding transcriptional ArsR family regulator
MSCSPCLLSADSEKSGLTIERSLPILNHMVNHPRNQLDLTFAAISDPIRRAILVRLQQGATSVTELAAPHAVSPPAISRHLRVLERAGLIDRTKEGRVHRVRLVARPIKDAHQWLESYRQFWEGRLDALGNYVDELNFRNRRRK